MKNLTHRKGAEKEVQFKKIEVLKIHITVILYIILLLYLVHKNCYVNLKLC